MSKKPKPSDDAHDLVGQTMAGIAEEASDEAARARAAAESRERRDARVRQAAILLLPLCLMLTVLNIAGFDWFRSSEPPPLAEPERQREALQVLSDAVDELDFYRQETGRYPDVPDFVGPDGLDGDDEPFGYRLMGSERYVLSVTLRGETYEYDSRLDPADFFREVRDAR